MIAEPAKSLEKEKLARLAEEYGSSVEELLEDFALDSLVPGICMNAECDFTTEYEPDQRAGWCEHCGSQTVKSLLVLVGVI
ncbi:MAG TPA: hypothetical protein VN493_06015 [Thermoanaerobaculia bacterium]|nr:hypothetical protein [Thermoanaerobaculia bacterium]